MKTTNRAERMDRWVRAMKAAGVPQPTASAVAGIAEAEREWAEYERAQETKS